MGAPMSVQGWESTGRKTMKRATRIGMLMALIPAAVGALPGCSLDGWLHATASLGGATAGQRGNTEVVFINNTPYRAIFTFGTFDELDRESEPTLRQFSSATDTLNLEGNSQSDTLTVQCARVYSIGGEELIKRVRAMLDEDEFEEAALVEGVNFSSAAVDDEMADAPTEGTAAPLNAYIGADFECGALLIYRFEMADSGPNPFVVELTIIPGEDNRG